VPTQWADQTDSPHVPIPCDGPKCRQSRDQLPGVPPAPSRQFDGPERWCQFVQELTFRPLLCSLLPLEPDQMPVCGVALRIERPPKGAALPVPAALAECA